MNRAIAYGEIAHGTPEASGFRSAVLSAVIAGRRSWRRDVMVQRASASSFARPSLCHCFIRQKPEPFSEAFRETLNVRNDDAHLLKVADRLRWTKRSVSAKFTKDLNGSHTATAEEI